MLRPLLTLSLVLSAVVPLAAQTVPITACGDTVPAGQSGVVMNDITCPSDPGVVIVSVGDHGTLDLAGFVLTGGDTGVLCGRRCTVTSTGGTGTIQSTASAGIAVVGDKTKLLVDNISLANISSFGIFSDLGGGVVRGTQLSVTGTGTGIGVQARTARLTNFTANGIYTALQIRVATLDGAAITSNAAYGIVGRTARVRNSTVTGSGGGVDLFTDRPPRLVNTVCDVSRDFNNPTVTWGVCAND